MDPMSGELLHTSEEICEALVRHVEASGSEVFEKNFVRGGRTICTVWCMVGPEAQEFSEAITEWLKDNGFKDERG